jgi:hypothetical protein
MASRSSGLNKRRSPTRFNTEASVAVICSPLRRCHRVVSLAARFRTLDLLNVAGLRKFIAYAVTACFLGGLACFPLGCGGGELDSTSNQPELNRTAEEHTSRAIAAGAFFSVLNRSRTSDDALPYVPRKSRGPVFAARGRSGPLSDMASAHAARRLWLSVPAWLVPESDERLCLLHTVKALTRGLGGRSLPPAIVQQCTTMAAATAGRLVVTQSLSASRRGSSAVVILGVVPDGVTTVSVLDGGGHAKGLPVRRNSYAGIVVDPKAVRFSDRVGHIIVSQLVPVASFDRRSARPAP